MSGLHLSKRWRFFGHFMSCVCFISIYVPVAYVIYIYIILLPAQIKVQLAEPGRTKNQKKKLKAKLKKLQDKYHGGDRSRFNSNTFFTSKKFNNNSYNVGG